MSAAATIYLDYQASTPVDHQVLEAMMPFLVEEYGNPHSGSHAFGRRASSAVKDASAAIASLLNADVEDVILTSGATEANNLILLGSFHRLSPVRRYITSAIEHPSVLEPAERLREIGAEVVVLPVGADGLVGLDVLAAELKRGPALVSIIAANNEIGVIQRLSEMGALCESLGSWFHTDATQLAGAAPIDMRGLSLSALTLSSHKIYGPKGIGALVARREIREALRPLLVGGGQQAGLRPGTIPVALAVGFGAACRLASEQIGVAPARMAALRNRFLDALGRQQVKFELNGSMERRLPQNANLRLAGVEALALFALAPRLAISSGSACASGGSKLEPSHVLKAIGLSDQEQRSSVRVSVGRYTTEEEVETAAELLAAAVGRLQRLDNT